MFVLWGLHQLCHDPAVLATYSVAAVGCNLSFWAPRAEPASLLMRAGAIWDDARTILCTVLILLVAIRSARPSRTHQHGNDFADAGGRFRSSPSR